MLLTPFWLSVAALAGSAAAGGQAPVSSTSNVKFSVVQAANPAFTGYVATGQSALVKAYSKHQRSLPYMVKLAADKAAAKFQNEGSVVTEPEAYDSEYLCPVSIGTPPQNMFLDFDSGSSDLWVFSTETNRTEVEGQTLYNPSTSTTSSSLTGETWEILYGDGSTANGDVWVDVIDVGGVVVPHQAIETAENVSPSFSQDTPNSGLLGLAFSKLNTVRPNAQQTFFANVQGLLNQGLFTADLKAGAIGTYNFGYIDTNRTTSPVSYTALNSTQGFWGVSADGFLVGNITNTSTPTEMTLAGIVDTGTSLIFLPDLVTEAYYGAIPGATFSVAEGGWIINCDNVVPPTLPDLTIVFGSYLATVPGDYLNYAPSATQPGYCFGGLQSSADLGINIFGDVFIKSQFVVFDAEFARVGFATKNLDYGPNTTP